MLEKNPDNLRETPDRSTVAVDATAFAGVEAQAFDEAVQDGVFVSSEIPDNQGYGNVSGRVGDGRAAKISSAETAEAAAEILDEAQYTPGILSVDIPQEVLNELMPDDEIIVLSEIGQLPRKPIYAFCKRAFDLVACSLALIVFAIPMAAVAVKVKLDSPGPVIYSQHRLGKDGCVFEMYKFRSMYLDAEAKGARWAAGDDPRVTPFGHFMRKTRVDELPQFWNVVKGDMSLIGPRPERPAFAEEFEKKIVGFNQRTLVRPGLSGLAQVTGGYELLPKNKVLYDLEYICNAGIFLDLKIMAKTAVIIFTGRGAR